ncbi:MAG: hypothetical protein GIW99_05025, partial [Candidatus Eremiobacteraeota bacterium]|nr:hypothetical protein [Candidatus Eremiobacteraeota bacterium]
AIEAAGESGVEVRLNPVDAEACIDENARVLADSALGRGTVVASGAMGSVFASLHDRSLLLARWAAGEK